MTNEPRAPSGCLPAALAIASVLLFFFVWVKFTFVAAFAVASVGMVGAIAIGSAQGRAHARQRQAVRDIEMAQHQAFMAAKDAEAEARRQSLYQRYGRETAEAIIAGRYWRGATIEMMRESLGVPADVRQKVLKTKSKATFCYFPINARQYGLKLHFENGVVVGWDA